MPPGTSSPDIRAETGWHHLVKVLSHRMPHHLAQTAAARRKLNRLHGGRSR